jgi:glycosyltransferase involved in cell wall biosynthesis
MVKLVHVITSMERGGAQSMLVKLVDELENKGVYHQEIVVITGSCQYKFKSNINIYFLDMSINRFFIRDFIKFRKLIKTLSPDLIQSWMYHANFLSFFSGLKKKKVIFNIRHSLNDANNEKKITKVLINIGSYLSNFVFKTVYCSKVSMEQHQKIGYSKTSSTYIPNGFDYKRFSPSVKYRELYRKKLSISDDAFVFGSIARFHPMKNHIGLIKEFSLLRNDSILLLIGEGVINKEVKSLILDLKIKDKVILLTRKEDIYKWIHVIDSLVIPSLWGEAFPNILGEAMSAEIPCIVSNIGDCSLILGDCGINIEKSICNSMRQMLDFSIEDRKKLGVAARYRIIKNYSISNSTNKYSSLYMSIL